MSIDSTEYKYRSLSDETKLAVLENNRRSIEEQHYGVTKRVAILRTLPALDNRATMDAREREIAQYEESLKIWEGMLDGYNSEMQTLLEAQAAQNTPAP